MNDKEITRFEMIDGRGYIRTMCEDSDVLKLESRIEEAEEFIEGVRDWKDAYPEDVFPPIGEDTLKMMCKSAGISMDRLSATVLRKCVIGWSNSAEALLNKKQNK